MKSYSQDSAHHGVHAVTIDQDLFILTSTVTDACLYSNYAAHANFRPLSQIKFLEQNSVFIKLAFGYGASDTIHTLLAIDIDGKYEVIMLYLHLLHACFHSHL